MTDREENARVLADAQRIRNERPARKLHVPAVQPVGDVELLLKQLVPARPHDGVTLYLLHKGRAMRVTIEEVGS